jgi:acyl-CoA synthetase (AMP-forming)/AMP-acid ligase II
MITEALAHTTADTVCLIPPYVEAIGTQSELCDGLFERGIRTIMWAGGDISEATGKAVSARFHLFPCFGSTETGLWPGMRSQGAWDRSQWHYMRLHPAAKGRFEPRSDGLFEMILTRKNRADGDYVQPVFEVRRDVDEFSSGDLFAPHPSMPHLWRHAGRTDDLLVFASGAKFHPTAVEAKIATHSAIKGVSLVGTKRPEASLLVELNPVALPDDVPEAEAHSNIVNQIWPLIEETNIKSPTYAQIGKNRILVIDPRKKPLSRSMKGGIQRWETVRAFQAELDHLYESIA